MDRGLASSYPASSHGVSSYEGAPRHSLGRRYQQYSSDPTFLDSPRPTSDESYEQRGRRSAQGSYTPSEENENMTKEAHRLKKKKMKRLRSFVHVFLGGLRKKNSVVDGRNRDVIAVTRYRQRDERDGITGSPSREGNTTAEQRDGEKSKNAPKLVLPRIANGEIPGLCGLHNHGNTCFMNAVLQCLSNTDHLAEYFVTDQFRHDLNTNGKIARRFGTSGDVTEQLALLLKCLWNGQYDPRVTSKFKEVIGRHAEQYQGTSQHDAQEFLLWLLDSVHEDLNQAAKKKYRPIKDSTGRPDEEVAAETLASHMKSNNSFIQNLFQGQFRSALICPSCKTRSATFDPYVCVSLPLLQRETRPVYVTVVYRSTGRKTRVFGVNVSINATVKDLRNGLAEKCGVNRYHLVLCDLNPDGFHRTFYDDQHISVIHGQDLVFAFECPPYRGDNPEAHTPANPSGSKELVLILVINKIGQTQYGKRFGSPAILRVWRDLTHSQFQSVVLKGLSKYLREGIKLPDVCRSGVLFRCRVMDGLPGRCILPTDVDHPLYSPSVDKALHVSMLYGGPAHIKIVAEWEPETKATLFGVIPDEIPEPHSSVTELREYYKQPLEASLEDCLKIYTREETLNREDSWFCPHCKQQQHDATKKITLWTLPDVLILHLKRFRQVGYSRAKLNTLVKFPITGLDMTSYLAQHAPQRHFRDRLQVPRSGRGWVSGTMTLPPKSVRFEDQSSSGKHNLNRSASTGRGSGRFHLPWKKKSGKERERSPSPDPPGTVYSPPVVDSPASIRSAPSTVGAERSVSPSRRSRSPRSEFQRANSLQGSRLDNVYDLYAVCNHLGSMSRGHYTSYCKNPADGNWYMFDDSHVQPITEEQLVTQGAYMLFYVRQSLLVQSPLSCSDSSASSSGSSTDHWVFHIPQFVLDLSGYDEEDAKGELKPQPRSRLGSANSATSAPPTTGYRVSPPSSAHDNDCDVFTPSSYGSQAGRHHASDARSAVSLPPYNPNNTSAYLGSLSGVPRAYQQPPNYEQAVAHSISSPTHSNRRILTSGRHPSLRLGKARHASPETSSVEGNLKRGGSFHSPKHMGVQRSETLPVWNADNPLHQPPVMPSRSIPNMPLEMSPQRVPVRSFSQDPDLNFLTPPLPVRQSRSSSFSNSSVHSGNRHPGAHQTESCV